MKRRMLALLLALVLTLSMLPTAFAAEDVQQADTAQGAEEPGKTEEKAEPAPELEEKPEAEPQEEPKAEEEPQEEPATEEMQEEAVPLSDDSLDDNVYFLLGERLKKGYYRTTNDYTSDDGSIYREGTTLDMTSRSDTAPEGRENYIYYEDGTLTVYGTIDASASGSDGVNAVLQASIGDLTVNGSGILRLYGMGIPALAVNYTASIDFAMTKGEDDDQQLSISSNGYTAVMGNNVKVSSAAHVWIGASNYLNEENVTYNTIEGNAVLCANRIALSNELGGACIKGNLTANAPDYLQIINQSETSAALTGGTEAYQLTTDQLNMQSYCGPMIDGDVVIQAVGKKDNISFWINGCTTDDVPVVKGNMEVSGGDLALVNQNDFSDGSDERFLAFKDYVADGPILEGNLTLKDMTGFSVWRQTDSDATLLHGNLTMTDCYRELPNYFSITRQAGNGAALDGNLTLDNSQLQIGAYTSDGKVSSEPGVKNCNLTMENSFLSVYSENNDWHDITIYDEEYLWYADMYAMDSPTYNSGTKRSFTWDEAKGKRYLEICAGDKIPVRTATSSGSSIRGTTGQPVSAELYVNLSRESFDFSKVPGFDVLEYTEESGKTYNVEGLPAGTDLTKYFTLSTPCGGTWKIRAAEITFQGGNMVRLTIAGTPARACSEAVEMKISGKILSGGSDLEVKPGTGVCWEITGETTEVEVADYTNIDSAAAFAQLAGSSVAKAAGNTVTLLDDFYPERGMYLTGDFTIDLNGHEILIKHFLEWGEASIYSKDGRQTITDSQFDTDQRNLIQNGINVCGGELTLRKVEVSAARTDSGELHIDQSFVDTILAYGGTTDVNESGFRYADVEDSTITFTNSRATEKNGLSLGIRKGGNVTIDGADTNIPGRIAILGGELTIEQGKFYNTEGTWLTQEGGNVTVTGGTFHGIMDVFDGALDITGGTFEAYNVTDLRLYQQGGHVSIQNATLNAEPVTITDKDGEYTVQQCIQVNGGTLEISNAQITGAVTALGKSAKSTTLTLTGTSVEATEEAAVRVFGGTVTIEDACKIYSAYDALLISGKNAAATISGSSLKGEAVAVNLLDGGSFTMESGTLEGAVQGIAVGGAKSKLTVNGGYIKSDEVALYVQAGNTVKLAGGEFEGGMKAILTGASNMKGWLQKGYEMTGTALESGFDAEKTNETGAGTVIVAEVNKEAAQRVSELIDEVTADVKLKSEEALANAEAAYQALTKQQQALVKNYKKLTAAWKTWQKLKDNEEYAKEGEAIEQAIRALELPADTAQISVEYKDGLEEVNEQYTKASSKAKSYIDKTLTKQLTAAVKVLKKNITAAEKVENLFGKIEAKDVDSLRLTTDRKTVEAAKKALDNLKTEAQKSFVNPEIREKIERYSERMEILKENAKLIQTAEKAIKSLPTAEKIKFTDKKKLDTATAAVTAVEKTQAELRAQEGLENIELTISNIERYNASKAAYEAYEKEAEFFKTNCLKPIADLEDVDSTQAQLVYAARQGYKTLGSGYDNNVTKNVQSFITKQELAQLTALEKLLKKNQAAAAKVDKLIAKIPADAATDEAVAKDKKNLKAIDAAWKAYDGDKGLTDAQKTFLINEQHLIDSYNLAHGVAPKGDNILHIQFVDSETEKPIALQEIFAADATFGLGRSTKGRKELTASVFKQAEATDTEFVFQNVPDRELSEWGGEMKPWGNYQLYFDYNEVNYEHPASPGNPYTIGSGEYTEIKDNEYFCTLKLTKHFLRLDFTTVTEDNALDILEDQTAAYDYETNTLTLNNAKLGENDNLVSMAAIQTNIRDLTIEIPEGTTSTVKSTKADGIVCKRLHIEGAGTLTFTTDVDYRAIESTGNGETGTLQITGTTVCFDEYSGGITCGAFIVENEATIESAKVYLRSGFVDAASIRISDSTVDLMSCDTSMLRTHGDIEISKSNVTLYSSMSCLNVERPAYLLFAEVGTVTIDAASAVNIIAPDVETDKDHELLCATNGIKLGKGMIIRDQDGKKCTVYRPKDGGNYSVQCADGKSYPTRIFVAKSDVSMPDYTIPQ